MTLYNLYNYETKEYVGTYSTKDVAEKLSIRQDNINNYSQTNYNYKGYLIKREDEDDNLINNETINNLLNEFDKYRLMILNSEPKITKTIIKKTFTIWKEKPENKK